MFKVIFTLPASRLEKLIATTTSGGFQMPSIGYEVADPAPGQSKKRRPYNSTRRGFGHGAREHVGRQIICITDKKTMPGTKREAVITALENLETINGVGKVTRTMLRDKCNELGIKKQVTYQLLYEGYLKAG